jgi:hypothetical protein
MWSNSDCASCSFTCAHAGSRLSAKLNRSQRAEAVAHLRDVRLDEVRAQQAHAAVDIETNTACARSCDHHQPSRERRAGAHTHRATRWTRGRSCQTRRRCQSQSRSRCARREARWTP